MTPELVETYLSAIAADHVHDIDYGHPYDVVRDLGRAAVAHLDGEVPRRDSFGELTVSVSSLCMGDDMWETVLEAADAIRSQHAALRGTTTESDIGPARGWSGLDEDRLAALANQIRRAAYAWLITRDLVEEGVCGQCLLEQAGVAADVALGHAPRGQHSPEILHQADQVESLFGEFFDLMESAALAGLRSINARRSTHAGDSGGPDGST